MVQKAQENSEGLEQEIKEVVEKEKEHAASAQKISEEEKKVQEASKGLEKTHETPDEGYKSGAKKDYAEKPKTDYIENQEFYVKNEEDFRKIKDTLKEIKSEDSGLSRVDDSDFYEIDPDTKSLKIRKMPRSVLDRLKEKQVILDYYKILS
jgi:hypothetical protein